MGSVPGVNAERGSRGARARAGADLPKKKPDLKKVMPEIWKLVRPRRWLLAGGLALVAVNRLAGLVLPLLTKPFVDQVITKHHGELLPRLVVEVFLATLLQAITSFSNTQLLSKAAQRMIAELRQQVQ